MKNLLFVLGCFLSIITTAQEIDKPYDFPAKPGTEQWTKLTSSKQMDEICVVPEEVLNTISTKALLITCLNYPRLIDLFLASDLQTGFNFYSSHFNGLANLLKRPDLSKVLLTTYSEFDYSSNQIKGYDQKFTSKQIAFFECILAQKEIIKTFEKNNRLQLLSQAIKNLEQRKRHKESFYRQRTPCVFYVAQDS